MFTEIPRLQGESVVLEPLRMEHENELAEAAAEMDLHKLWYTQIPSPSGMAREIERRLRLNSEGVMVPWTVRDLSNGRALGMTTFLGIRPEHRRLEIGYTWLRASTHGTRVNPEMKMLQLTHAFEQLECIAVEFRVHFHNFRSRRAVTGIGARQDGVLRNHDLWTDGTMRDLVVFSIIESEWPTVKKGLHERLNADGRS